MSVKSGKNQMNVTLMSKRSIEENDKNRVNYRNNNNWIQNTFNNNNNENNKRIKRDNEWTQLTHPTHPTQGLTSNTNAVLMNTQDMNLSDDDNGLDDGFDDIISQAVDASQYCYSVGTDSQEMCRSADHNMSSISQTILKNESDVSMNTNTITSHPSSNDSSEASEGRLKILESRNQKLNEEIMRYKTLNIQLSHKLHKAEDENKIKLKQMCDSYDSSILFERNERQFQSHLLEALQASHKICAPNAPIVQRTAEYLSKRKKSFRNDFSQMKMQEFYDNRLSSAHTSAHTSSMPSATQPFLSFSQSTPLSVGDILVPESQSSVCSKRSKMSATFPSQISSTQMIDSPMSWTPRPMDSVSVTSNERTLREADSSQTQSSKINWSVIRVVLEQKYSTDRTQINQFSFEPQQEFDDQWIRQNQELNDWTTTLNQLSEEMEVIIQPIVRF